MGKRSGQVFEVTGTKCSIGEQLNKISTPAIGIGSFGRREGSGHGNKTQRTRLFDYGLIAVRGYDKLCSGIAGQMQLIQRHDRTGTYVHTPVELLTQCAVLLRAKLTDITNISIEDKSQERVTGHRYVTEACILTLEPVSVLRGELKKEGPVRLFVDKHINSSLENLNQSLRTADVGKEGLGDIEIAAVNVVCAEIYVNPAAGLTLEEWKFVLAHEYLHAGLQHHARRKGRDPYLWNIACDFVINSWLHEMQIGTMPQNGLMYDESLKNMSAEEIYDRLTDQIRKNAKLGTFRGYGKGDIIDKGWTPDRNKPTTLDDFCICALRSGLEYHTSTGRGYIPAGLIEEIKALSMPPVPWDVELAKWFDTWFMPFEKHRTYARPSRRQSSTPEIPRPSWVRPELPEYSRTYAVIIDTSGSMSPEMIGKALGAAASYSVAKEVPLVRVVFCDADAYDAGYIAPEDIAGRVIVKGRGGTALQPAVDLLEKAKDFPKNGPILIITDAGIEPDLIVRHEHAFLIPDGARLPFRPKGKVFYFK